MNEHDFGSTDQLREQIYELRNTIEAKNVELDEIVIIFIDILIIEYVSEWLEVYSGVPQW